MRHRSEHRWRPRTCPPPSFSRPGQASRGAVRFLTACADRRGLLRAMVIGPASLFRLARLMRPSLERAPEGVRAGRAPVRSKARTHGPQITWPQCRQRGPPRRAGFALSARWAPTPRADPPEGDAVVARLARDGDAGACFEPTGSLEWPLRAWRVARPARSGQGMRVKPWQARPDRPDRPGTHRPLPRPQTGCRTPPACREALDPQSIGLAARPVGREAQAPAGPDPCAPAPLHCRDVRRCPHGSQILTGLDSCLDMRTRGLEGQTALTTSSADALADTSAHLRSMPGIGPVTRTMAIAEMPRPGVVTSAQAASRVGLARVAHDSGPCRAQPAPAESRRD